MRRSSFAARFAIMLGLLLVFSVGSQTVTAQDGTPAATPAAIVASLHAATQRALASPEVRERLTGVGGEVVTGTQPMFASYLHSERVHYEKLIREGGIKPD